MSLTGPLSALVRPAEAGRVVAAELKENRLAVEFACFRHPVTRPLLGDGAVEKADLLKRTDRSAHLRFGESKIRSVGQLAPVNWEG
jgi:hypothetical protein